MGKLIVLDAGHGYHTAGRRCMKQFDPNETREWELNNRIAVTLQDMLSEYDCEILRVDDPTGGTDVSLADRIKTANSNNAIFYLSIHHNGGINGGTGGGTIVFYYLDDKMKKMAQGLYDSVIKETKLKGNRSMPVSCYGYDVIAQTKMPALLIENGFMDSKTDVPIIITKDHRIKTARGILNWLVSEFDLVPLKQQTPDTDKKDNTIYRVQVGAYAIQENAYNMVNQLRKAGFTDAYVVPYKP